MDHASSTFRQSAGADPRLANWAIRGAFRVGLLLGAAIAFLGRIPDLAADEKPLDRFEFSKELMGAPFRIVLYSEDQATASRAAQDAFDRVAELDAALSDYKSDSELSRLCQTAGQGRLVEVGADLWRVLERSRKLAKDSEGAFDVTVGPLVKLWRRARRTKSLPGAEALAEAKTLVGHELLTLNDEYRTVKLSKPGMRIDLGGIAMGYAVDEARIVLGRHGQSRVMIDASGDVLVGDPPPGKTGWTIGIAALTAPNGPPTRFVELVNAAITTSGDAFQYVEIEGVRYSHIVDPKTGLGLTGRMAVTVIAQDCMTADSLATAICVLGSEKGLALAEKYEAQTLIARMEEERLAVDESPQFHTFESPSAP